MIILDIPDGILTLCIMQLSSKQNIKSFYIELRIASHNGLIKNGPSPQWPYSRSKRPQFWVKTAPKFGQNSPNFRSKWPQFSVKTAPIFSQNGPNFQSKRPQFSKWRLNRKFNVVHVNDQSFLLI